MLNDNPYAAPQTVNTIEQAADHEAVLVPSEFRWFPSGAYLLLFAMVGFVAVMFMESRTWLLLPVSLFLIATVLLATIPSKTPGQRFFVCSAVLQIISPLVALQAIQDVPDPDWDRFFWYQRLGIWGEMLALVCVVFGFYRIATRFEYFLMRWSSLAALGFLSFSYFYDVWIRSEPRYYEVILYAGIWILFGIIPAFLSMIICFACATEIPKYVRRPQPVPYNRNQLPKQIEIQLELLREESPATKGPS